MARSKHVQQGLASANLTQQVCNITVCLCWTAAWCSQHFPQMHACWTANALAWSTSSGPTFGWLVNFIWSFHCKFLSCACTVGSEYNAEACLAGTLQYDACRLELNTSEGCAWCCPCGVSMASLDASKVEIQLKLLLQ